MAEQGAKRRGMDPRVGSARPLRSRSARGWRRQRGLRPAPPVL